MAETATNAPATAKDAFMQGASGALSGPAWVLVISFFGFGALAQDLGFTGVQSFIMAALMYALPGQVVLAAGMAGGMTLVPLFLAVSVSAVRLLPMTVSLVPVLRTPSTPRWKLYLLAHFVAITIWIETNRRLPVVPRPLRLSYFTGFGTAMISTSTISTMVGHQLAPGLPPLVGAALLFLMPIYFLVTLSSSARALADRYAFVIGLVLGPLAFLVFPEGDLMVTGLVGGTAGWLIARKKRVKP